jgi:hypothetical protein
MTSFRRAHVAGAPVYSAAVYQPKGYALPKADWTDIRVPAGDWIRPREFLGEPDPLRAYAEALVRLYDSRIDAAREWFERVGREYHACALCCWCPYDRAAQRQLAEFGSFVCHTGPLGWWIENRLGVRVWNDTDRARMKAIL